MSSFFEEKKFRQAVDDAAEMAVKKVISDLSDFLCWGKVNKRQHVARAVAYSLLYKAEYSRMRDEDYADGGDEHDDY